MDRRSKVDLYVANSDICQNKKQDLELSEKVQELGNNSKVIFDLTRSEREQNQVKLPKFNMRVYSKFVNHTEVSKMIVNHFKRPSPFPLAFGGHGHATAITGIAETTCTLEQGNLFSFYTFHLLDSGGANDSYDLEAISKGLALAGGFVEVEPCEGHQCLNYIENEKDLASLALIHYIDAEDQQAVENLIERKDISNELINQVDGKGFTSLHHAVHKKNLNILNTLLKHGANKDKRDLEGWPPLCYAVDNDHLDSVKALVEGGANIDIQTPIGRTPLIISIKMRKTHIAKYLISKGANIQLSDEAGRTPLYYAVDREETDLVKLLLNQGAPITSLPSNMTTEMSILIDKERQIRAHSRINHNRLQDAWNGYPEIVNSRIAGGAHLSQESIDRARQSDQLAIAIQ